MICDVAFRAGFSRWKFLVLINLRPWSNGKVAWLDLFVSEISLYRFYFFSLALCFQLLLSFFSSFILSFVTFLFPFFAPFTFYLMLLINLVFWEMCWLALWNAWTYGPHKQTRRPLLLWSAIPVLFTALSLHLTGSVNVNKSIFI